MASDYEVGWGKPPKETQFKKGQSGHPQGRPRGSRNLKTDLMEEMREQILVREGERPKRISKQRALVKSVTAKAIKGDARAAAKLIELLLRVFGTDDEAAAGAPLSTEERAVLDTLEARILRRRGLTKPEGGRS